MKRPAFLVLAGAVILGVISNGQVLHGQGKKGRPVQKQAAINQATMLYRADAMRRQQAALAAALAQQARWQQAAWHAKARQSATVLVRTSGATKGTQPVILSNQVTSRMRGPVNEVTVRTSLPTSGPFAVNPQRGKYQFKETWSGGAGVPAGKTRFTEQVAVRAGKEVIKDKWSAKASSPALAYLPLQVQIRQLENLLPYQAYPYQAWFGYSQPWYAWYPGYLGAPGQKTIIQSKIRWPGGAETLKTQIVNQYDKAGRLLGVQVRIKDSPKGNAAALAPLSPQAQIYLLEAAAAPVGYYPYTVYNPLAYSWNYPYYRTDWMALERLAALEGLPIW